MVPLRTIEFVGNDNFKQMRIDQKEIDLLLLRVEHNIDLVKIDPDLQVEKVPVFSMVQHVQQDPLQSCVRSVL